MARVQGVKEKLHAPVYDAFFNIDPLRDFATAVRAVDPRVIRLFVDIQNKTRLETNLQAAGQLPSLNTLEARAMRVVVSAPPTFETVENEEVILNPDIFVSELIYNSVTSLIVGEKTMIEMPTFYFPAGAGVSPGNGAVPNHGEPDPLATFRFSEPVIIEPQQNFRVEMLFPRDLPERIQPWPAPVRIWVVLDGYVTRDVQ
jgi:hypothetical protein